MSWNLSTKGESSFPLLAEDMYDAVCYQIIDLGTQRNEYQGDVKHQHQVYFGWAIPSETVEIDGKDKPRVVSKFYTASLSPRANLRKDLEGWRGKAFDADGIDNFDITKVLGTSCRLLVGTTQTGKSNKVESVRKAKEKVSIPEELEPIVFQLSDYAGGPLPEGIHEWLQEKIKLSPEYKQKNMKEVSVGAGDDDEPTVVAEEAGDSEEDLPF